VPKEIIPDDHLEIKHFNTEYGLIKEISPEEYTKNTYQQFQKDIESWTADGLDFDPGDNSFSRLHKDKVYDKLREELIALGWKFDGTWFTGRRTLIGSYMTYLANEISNRNKLSLMTLDVPAWTCQEYMNYKRGL